jgi:hypothetical protein
MPRARRACAHAAALLLLLPAASARGQLTSEPALAAATDAGEPESTSAAPDDPLASDAITVSAVRPTAQVSEHSVEREELRVLPGTGGDVLRSIESLPGVARPPVTDALLIIRGSAPEDSAIFVDGTDVPLAYHLGGATSIIPGDVIDHLDFYPGNFGPQYGRAMGGVVDVGLRSPRSDRFGALAQVDVVDGRLMLESPIGPDTRLLLAGRRSWVDAWLGSVIEDSSTSVQTAPVYWDWQAVLEHDFSEQTRARLAVFGGDDRFALLIDSPSAQDPVGGALSAGTTYNRVQLRLDTELGSATQLSSMLAWGITDAALSFGGSPFEFTWNSLQARAELRYRPARWLSWTTGIDAVWTHYDVNARFSPYPSANETPGPYFARPKRSLEANVSSLRPAAYTQLELTLAKRLTLLPSLRADYASDTGDWTFDPRVGARFRLVSGERPSTLKAGLGIFHQPPQPQESLEPVGTPGVRSNASAHASLGVEQRLGDALELSVEGFYKQLWDLVVAHPDEDSALGARFENTGRGRAYGAEVLLRLLPDGPLHGWIAYTLSRSQRRDDPHDPYYTFEWDQTHILSAVAQLELGWGMSFGTRFRYATGMPFTPYAGSVVDLDAGAYAPLPSGRVNEARLPPFHQLDLRVDKLWEFQTWTLTLYFELRNAYNRENADAMTYNYDYSRSKSAGGLPLLPVLGVRGEL